MKKYALMKPGLLKSKYVRRSLPKIGSFLVYRHFLTNEAVYNEQTICSPLIFICSIHLRVVAHLSHPFLQCRSLCNLYDDFSVITFVIVFVDLRSSFILARRALAPPERLSPAVSVNCRRATVHWSAADHRRAGPCTSRSRQTPSAGDHHRRKERRNTSANRVSQNSPGRTRSPTRGSLLRQILRSRTRLVQVRTVNSLICFAIS